MGTSRADPSPVLCLSFIHIWASLFIFMGLQPWPFGSRLALRWFYSFCSNEEGHMGDIPFLETYGQEAEGIWGLDKPGFCESSYQLE